MSLATLNASIDRAFATISRRPETKASNPLSGYTDTGFYGGDRSYDSGQQADQLAHFRGRFSSAVRVIVSRMVRQPVYVARRRKRGERAGSPRSEIQPPAWMGDPKMLDVLPVHPFLGVWRDPNEYMTSVNAMEMFVMSAYVTGRAFWIWVEGKGRPLDMFPVPATWMCPVHEKGKPYAYWRMKPPGTPGDGMKLENGQVAHFYFADPANPLGALAPLSLVARDVLVDEAISAAQHASFKNPMPRFALIAGDVMNEQSFSDDPNRSSAARPVRLDPMHRRQIITWMRQQGMNFAKGDPLILDALIRDIKEVGRTNQEMAFLESAGLTKEHIFEAVSVSKVLTGSLEGTNRAGAGLADQFLCDHTINPLITGTSQVLTKRAGSLFADEGEKLAVWIAEAEPRDTELFLEKLRIGTRAYAVTRNEVRRLLNFNLPQLPGYDDVVIPQTLEERTQDQDLPGVGRIAADQKPADEDEEDSDVRRVSLNGNGLHRLNGHH